MTTLTHLPREAQAEVPWKNGGGTTREVAVDPPGVGTGGPFRWRVSVASVARDGPFSSFPGVDRRLWLLRGAGLRLSIEGAERRLETALEEVAFPGEARVEGALLDGPTEDLNLMHDRARVTARPVLVRLRAREAWRATIPAPGEDLLLLLEGALRARPPAGAPVQLGAGDALRLDGGAPGRAWDLVAGPGPVAALLASFSPRA